jgi:propionyl-CoA carboxylase alpha chain
MAEKYLVRVGNIVREVEIEEDEEGLRAFINDHWHRVNLENIGSAGLFSLLVDDRAYEVFAEKRSDGYDLLIGSRLYPASVEPVREQTSSQGFTASPQQPSQDDWIVVSPMTGVVLEVRVTAGQEVEAGAVLLIVEAMKMNNEIRAQRAGVIESVHVEPGQKITQGTTMLRLKQA